MGTRVLARAAGAAPDGLRAVQPRLLRVREEVAGLALPQLDEGGETDDDRTRGVHGRRAATAPTPAPVYMRDTARRIAGGRGGTEPGAA